MTFRLTDDLRAKLQRLAEQERRSMAWLVAEAVREFVEGRLKE